MPTTVTSTIKSSGGSYTSIVAWEAAKQADIAAADQIQEAECYSSITADPGVIITGWTTDATRYIRIFTPAGQRHTGIPATGYRMLNTGFQQCITATEENVRIEGIAMLGNTSSPTAFITQNATGVCDQRISYCFIDGNGTGANGNHGIVCGTAAAGSVWRIWNNIVTNCLDYGLDFNPTNGTLYLYNNTFTGNGREAGGFFNVRRASGTVIAKNNIADERTTTGSNAATGGWTGSYDAASTNNLASDATAPGSSPQNSKSVVYVDAANRNFHLDPTDTAAKDMGATASDANITFSDDIDGDARGATWDIGADEIAAAAPANWGRMLGGELNRLVVRRI